MAVFRCGVDFAGIHAEIQLLLGEKLYLSRFTKIHKKKEITLSVFCIIQISQSDCFYLRIYRIQYVQKTVYRMQMKKGNYCFLVILMNSQFTLF